jgi:hypothetical protein
MRRWCVACVFGLSLIQCFCPGRFLLLAWGAQTFSLAVQGGVGLGQVRDQAKKTPAVPGFDAGRAA